MKWNRFICTAISVSQTGRFLQTASKKPWFYGSWHEEVWKRDLWDQTALYSSSCSLATGLCALCCFSLAAPQMIKKSLSLKQHPSIICPIISGCHFFRSWLEGLTRNQAVSQGWIPSWSSRPSSELTGYAKCTSWQVCNCGPCCRASCQPETALVSRTVCTWSCHLAPPIGSLSLPISTFKR